MFMGTNILTYYKIYYIK